MNKIMKAITALCNAQRDRHFRTLEDRKRIRKPGEGFGAVLDAEQQKLKEGGTAWQNPNKDTLCDAGRDPNCYPMKSGALSQRSKDATGKSGE